jgi:hypothetical protein
MKRILQFCSIAVGLVLIFCFFAIMAKEGHTPYEKSPAFFAGLVFGAAGIYILAGLKAIAPTLLLERGWVGKSFFVFFFLLFVAGYIRFAF